MRAWLVGLCLLCGCASLTRPRLSPSTAEAFGCDPLQIDEESRLHAHEPVAPGTDACILLARFGNPESMTTNIRPTWAILSWSEPRIIWMATIQPAPEANKKWVVKDFSVTAH